MTVLTVSVEKYSTVSVRLLDGGDYSNRQDVGEEYIRWL